MVLMVKKARLLRSARFAKGVEEEKKHTGGWRKHHPDLTGDKEAEAGWKRSTRPMKYCPTARKEPADQFAAVNRILVAGIRAADLV